MNFMLFKPVNTDILSPHWIVKVWQIRRESLGLSAVTDVLLLAPVPLGDPSCEIRSSSS